MIDFVAGPSSYKAVDPRGPGLCQSQWLLSCRGLRIFKWLSAIFVKCDHRQIYICKIWHNFATLTSVALEVTSNSTTSLWTAPNIGQIIHQRKSIPILFWLVNRFSSFVPSVVAIWYILDPPAQSMAPQVAGMPPANVLGYHSRWALYHSRWAN